jgi:hypothetical protein
MPGDAGPPAQEEASGLIPYRVHTDHDYATVAASAFRPVPVIGGVELVGSCPQCTDPMAFQFVEETYRGFRFGRRAAPAPAADHEEVIPMICTCEADHPGRPNEGEGCGAYWNLVLRSTP